MYLKQSACLHRPDKYLKSIVRGSTDYLSTGVKGQTGELYRPGGGKCSEVTIPEEGRRANMYPTSIICMNPYRWTNLCKSNALTVPSKDALTTTLPEELNTAPVTAEECSENVTKQNPEATFHSFTCTHHTQSKQLHAMTGNHCWVNLVATQK